MNKLRDATPKLVMTSISHHRGSEPGPVRRDRRRGPAHYLLNLESFSVLSKLDMYESRVFEAGGYKWSLSLYPKGKHVSGYISLYLSIKETNKLPRGWQVDVHYTFFVYNHNKRMYLTLEDGDGAVRSFHDLKTQWGFSQLLSLAEFKDSSHQYLKRDDSCTFGAEVMVIKPTTESLTLTKIEPPNHKYNWQIPNFSKVNSSPCHFDFTVGEIKWSLWVYPKGHTDERVKSLSMYLQARHPTPERKVYAEFKLRVLNRSPNKGKEKNISHWFSASDSYKGHTFLPLKDLLKQDNGFLDKDVLSVQVQFLVTSRVKVGRV